MQTHHLTSYTTIIKAPVEKVWDALTNPEIVKQYFFGTNLITDWKVGSPLRFRGEWEGKPYEDKGEVLEYTPLKSLAYSYLSSWSHMPDEPENYLRVSYAVRPVNGGTEMTITQSNYDEERAQHSEGNWAMVMDGLRKCVE
jgi:uncharacterized protein YndB with AHSA1/START domain